jgi:hypothetical protein
MPRLRKARPRSTGNGPTVRVTAQKPRIPHQVPSKRFRLPFDDKSFKFQDPSPLISSNNSSNEFQRSIFLSSDDDQSSITRDPPKPLNQIGDPSMIHDSQICSDDSPDPSGPYGHPCDTTFQTSSMFRKNSSDFMLLPAPLKSVLCSGEKTGIASHQQDPGSHDIESQQQALGSHGFEMLSARFGYKYLNTYSYQVSKLPVNDRTTCDTSTTSHQMDNEFDDDYHDLPELHSSFDTLTQHPALLRPRSC